MSKTKENAQDAEINVEHRTMDPEPISKDPRPRCFTLWRPAQPEESGQDAAPLNPQVLHLDLLHFDVPQTVWLALKLRLPAHPRVVGQLEPHESPALEAQGDLD
eukprot:8131971-Pyramimonas_sp.AAC.2